LIAAYTDDFPKCRFLNLPFHNIYRVCDYCGKYKKIAILNQPVYYDKGRKRKRVSYCDECDGIPVIKRELVDGAWKILAYDGILEVMKNSAWKIRGIMTELLMTHQNRSVLRLPSGRPIIRIMR